VECVKKSRRAHARSRGLRHIGAQSEHRGLGMVVACEQEGDVVAGCGAQ
jgi:hypothetical protein